MKDGSTIEVGAANHSELSTVFELARVLTEAALLVSGEGEVLDANAPATDMLGLDVRKLREKRLHGLVNDPPETVDRYLGAWSRSGAPIPGALTWVSEDGRTAPCRCDGAVIRPEASHSPAVIFLRCTPKSSASSLFLDLNRELEALRNERRKMEADKEHLEDRVAKRTAELETANRELEAFSYSVSHDLRAPLRSMNGFSQILLEDYGDRLDEEGKDYLRRMRAASERMGQLIDATLDLSRFTRMEMHRKTVDLSALATSIAEELRSSNPDRRVEFVIEQGLLANGDERLVRVLLENLLGNAWKFTGEQPNPKIEFGVQGRGGRRVYYVRDNGVGFEMAYSDKLFGAFQRLHSESEFEGTGIGLATVARIVHRHGGEVWAEGGVRIGATFYFTL